MITWEKYIGCNIEIRTKQADVWNEGEDVERYSWKGKKIKGVLKSIIGSQLTITGYEPTGFFIDQITSVKITKNPMMLTLDEWVNYAERAHYTHLKGIDFIKRGEMTFVHLTLDRGSVEFGPKCEIDTLELNREGLDDE